MSRTNIDVDDEACAEVMRRYRLATKREAVNFALRTLAAEPLGVEEARRLARLRLAGRSRRAAFQPLPVILIDTSAWVEFLRGNRIAGLRSGRDLA